MDVEKKNLDIICYMLTSLVFFAARKCKKIDGNSYDWK